MMHICSPCPDFVLLTECQFINESTFKIRWRCKNVINWYGYSEILRWQIFILDDNFKHHNMPYPLIFTNQNATPSSMINVRIHKLARCIQKSELYFVTAVDLDLFTVCTLLDSRQCKETMLYILLRLQLYLAQYTVFPKCLSKFHKRGNAPTR